ncbi:MAG: 3-dehydroquinate synthase [Bacteroidales bacterium]|nr:3-dehydroquinate synthase [Bacteroidales bacterium]
MHQIKLTTPSGSTEISVGEHLSADLAKLDPVPVLLVDEHVLCQHYDQFSLCQCITVPSGERYKTLETIENIYRELVGLEVDRSSLLVGVGGGLATDVAGFVAATYLREVRFGFISTTLLGQVDASIGGKNGVNLDGYKNMIGTIRQPSFVWCDISLLETLARKEYVSGIAEVIKYGAIQNSAFLQYLKDQMPALLAMEKQVVEEVVTTSAAVKVDIVQKDEKESGLRMLLNFGHTIGHAIERDKKVLHGEAVAVGMVMAARLSNSLGLLKASGVDLIEELVMAAGLPAGLDLDPDEIFLNIRKDKKKSGDQIHFILLESLGNAVVRTIPLKDLKPILHDLC